MMGGMIGEINPIKHFGEWMAEGNSAGIFKILLFPDPPPPVCIRPSLMPPISEIKGTEPNSHSSAFIK